MMFVIKSEKTIQLINKSGVYLLGGMELIAVLSQIPERWVKLK